MAVILVKQEASAIRLVAQENLIFKTVQEIQMHCQRVLETTPVDIPLLLDLTHVQVVDSMGLKLVVGLLKSCQKQQRAFSLTEVSVPVAQVFKLSGLNEHLAMSLKKT